MSVIKGNHFHAKAMGDYESIYKDFHNFIMIEPKMEMASKYIPVRIGYKTSKGYESVIPNDKDSITLIKFVDAHMVYTKKVTDVFRAEEHEQCEEIFLLYEIINFPTDYQQARISTIYDTPIVRNKLIFELILKDQNFLTRAFYYETYWYPKEKKYFEVFDDTFSMLEAVLDADDNGVSVDEYEGTYNIIMFDSYGFEVEASYTMEQLSELVVSKRLIYFKSDNEYPFR